MAPKEGWVGIEEVAAHLRVAKESIYLWVDSEGLTAHRVGRLLRFKLSEVDEWVTAKDGDDSGSNPSAEKRRAARRISSRKKKHG